MLRHGRFNHIAPASSIITKIKHENKRQTWSAGGIVVVYTRSEMFKTNICVKLINFLLACPLCNIYACM